MGLDKEDASSSASSKTPNSRSNDAPPSNEHEGSAAPPSSSPHSLPTLIPPKKPPRKDKQISTTAVKITEASGLLSPLPALSSPPPLPPLPAIEQQQQQHQQQQEQGLGDEDAELTLEELEKGESLTSPFTSTTGVAPWSGIAEDDDEEEAGAGALIPPPPPPSSSSSLLDGIPVAITSGSSTTTTTTTTTENDSASSDSHRLSSLTASLRQQSLSLTLALAEDGFLTSPSSDGDGSNSSASSTPSSTSSPAAAESVQLLPPSPKVATAQAAALPPLLPSIIQQQQQQQQAPPAKHKRRLSLPGLALKPTPRTGGSTTNSFIPLDVLRAKLSGSSTPATAKGTQKQPTPTPSSLSQTHTHPPTHTHEDVPTPNAVTPHPPLSITTSNSNSNSNNTNTNSSRAGAAGGVGTGTDDAMLLKSARRLGLDITGLRKALLIRILGFEPVSVPVDAPGGGDGGGGDSKASTNKTTTVAKKKKNRIRSASTGMMPASWLKRTTAASSTNKDKDEEEEEEEQQQIQPTYNIVLWLYDVESGHEWRLRKSPLAFFTFHDHISFLLNLQPSTTTLWGESNNNTNDFPLRRGKSETTPPTPEKLAKLERYLRKLSQAMLRSPSGGGSSSFEVAKLLQDFVGATEKGDELARLTHTHTRTRTTSVTISGELRREDARRHLRQALQLHVVEEMLWHAHSTPALGVNGWEKKLTSFVEECNRCDVQKTDLLQAYNVFLTRTARELLEWSPQRGEEMRVMVRAAAAGGGGGNGGSSNGGGGGGGGAINTTTTTSTTNNHNSSSDEADIEQFILSSLRRVLEAETFLPLRHKLYERVTLETDMTQEKLLARKCTLFQTRPQSFFGIPVAHISISSWERSVEHLRRLSGDITTLPSDKLDALVAAVREIHACFQREHENAGSLGADEFLPVFIYVVSQCGISRLLSLKNMLAGLCDPARLMGEAGYCLATLEAAIEYILQLDEMSEEI